MKEERGAVGGQVTPYELKLLEALRTLGLNPGSQDHMSRMLHLLGGVKQDHEEVPPSLAPTHGEPRSFHYPKISIFLWGGKQVRGQLGYLQIRSSLASAGWYV